MIDNRDQWEELYNSGFITKNEFDSEECYQNWLTNKSERVKRQREFERQWYADQKTAKKLKKIPKTIGLGDLVRLDDRMTSGICAQHGINYHDEIGLVDWVMATGKQKGKLVYVKWPSRDRSQRHDSWQLQKVS
jgi:hypothetical protein